MAQPRAGDRKTRPTGPVAPGFRWFWTGETVSAAGSYVTVLALQTLVVLDLGGDAQDVGWLNSSRWLPYLVIGLLVGAWVDRWPRRPVMIATDLARAALLVAIPLAWWAGVLTLPALLAVVVAFGAASLFNDAASQSFVTRLVPRPRLQQAHARLDTGDAAAQTTGPALAGGLVSLVGASLAVLVDAASFLLSAAVVWRLRVEEPPAVDRRARPHLRREVAAGVRWVYRDSRLTQLAVSTHVWFAGQAVLGVVIAPYALVELGLSAFQLGVAVACAGAGAVLGAAVTGAVGRLLGTGPTIAAARVLAVAAALATAGAASVGAGEQGTAVVVLATGQLLSGLGMGLSNSHEMAYRQLRTPDRLQARTNTTMRSVNRGILVVAAPAAGLLVVLVGNAAALLVAAAVFAMSVGVLLTPTMRADRSTIST
ncbi:MFS transporter [Nocardioides sp. P86]|uniref:MFS transporter n=1 Tax=Nocardioides sp. P86 TaxID=2939569 RepID=UPI00203ACFE4|nr:MFS transporter [Nocardioides sp. P86]MCM3515239.1 MFS transporter [Nocardioides sp. P86]